MVKLTCSNPTIAEKKESLEKCLLPWEGYYSFRIKIACRSIFPVDALTWTKRHNRLERLVVSHIVPKGSGEKFADLASR